MGKRLIIKGADFSENGIPSLVVKSSVTTLYKRGGSTVGYSEETGTNEGIMLQKNGTPNDAGSNDAITDYASVSGCTKFVWNGSTDNVVAGLSTLFVAFYDEDHNLLTGKKSAYMVPKSGDTDMENGRYVDISSTLPVNQIIGDIPEGAVYVRATTMVGGRRKGNFPDNFSLDLYGYNE